MVALADLRDMRIPDRLSATIVAVFAVSLLWQLPGDLGARLLVAGAVFAVGFAGFCLRLVGGGDVKALAALMLFVPFRMLPLFALIFSASIVLGILLILGMRRLPVAAGFDWQSMRRPGTLPMGIAIAASGLVLPPAVALLRLWLL